MSRPRPLDLQRLHHVDGEMLRSRDFRDAVANDLELHWWHQRAVHQAYGIAAGLELFDPGDGTLTVEPGLAYDARGRDLLLLERTSIELPATRGPTTLVLRYRGGARGAALAWVRGSRVDPCEGVALTLLTPGKDRLLRPLRKRARSVARPRIGSGTTPPDATAWEPWRAIPGGTLRGIQVTVDTRSAGFTDVPCYFAWLQWPRLTTGAQPLNFFTLGIQYVQEETAAGFTFRTFLPRRGSSIFVALEGVAARGTDVVFARTQRLHVCWLGVQCDGGAVTGG